MREGRCPSGYIYDSKIGSCVRDGVENIKYSSKSHILRNIAIFAIGLAFGYFSLWSFGMLVVAGFLIFLGIIFFVEIKAIWYPVIGFIIGFVATYWLQISGFLHIIGVG